MDRRHFVQQSGLALAGLPLLRSGLAGFAAADQTPYQMRILRNNVGIFTEKGGTIAYYVSKKSIAVVDAEFPEQSQHLIDALKKIRASHSTFLLTPIITATIRPEIFRLKVSWGMWPRTAIRSLTNAG